MGTAIIKTENLFNFTGTTSCWGLLDVSFFLLHGETSGVSQFIMAHHWKTVLPYFLSFNVAPLVQIVKTCSNLVLYFLE